MASTTHMFSCFPRLQHITFPHPLSASPQVGVGMWLYPVWHRVGRCAPELHVSTAQKYWPRFLKDCRVEAAPVPTPAQNIHPTEFWVSNRKTWLYLHHCILGQYSETWSIPTHRTPVFYFLINLRQSPHGTLAGLQFRVPSASRD